MALSVLLAHDHRARHVCHRVHRVYHRASLHSCVQPCDHRPLLRRALGSSHQFGREPSLRRGSSGGNRCGHRDAVFR